MKNIFKWTAIGILDGAFLGIIYNTFIRFSLLDAILWIPAYLIEIFIRAFIWTPRGEQGFELMVISMMLAWPLLGGIFGFCYGAWKNHININIMPEQDDSSGPDQSQKPYHPILRFLMSHKQWSFLIAVIVMAVIYFSSHQITLMRDRNYLLHRVDHKEVAAACIEILSRPETLKLQYMVQFDGSDPKLPEAIRKMHAKMVFIGPHNIEINETNFSCSLHFGQNYETHESYDLYYREGMNRTLVYSIPKNTLKVPLTEPTPYGGL